MNDASLAQGWHGLLAKSLSAPLRDVLSLTWAESLRDWLRAGSAFWPRDGGTHGEEPGFAS